MPDDVTGGQDSVGLRCPAHPMALALLRAFGGGLAAPSANRFGHVSPTTAAHVRDEFGDAVPIVLDGGDCEVGIESTIVDLTSAHAAHPAARADHPRTDSMRVIGRGRGRRRRRQPARLGHAGGALRPAHRRCCCCRARRWQPRPRSSEALGKRVAVLALDTLPTGFAGEALPAHADGYAHGLYAALRSLDAAGATCCWRSVRPKDRATGWRCTTACAAPPRPAPGSIRRERGAARAARPHPVGRVIAALPDALTALAYAWTGCSHSRSATTRSRRCCW